MAIQEWSRPGVGGHMYNIPKRMAAIEQLRRAYPGRAGNGLTGLNSNDAAGWNSMLAEQREYQDYARGGIEGEMPVEGGATMQMRPAQRPYDPFSGQALTQVNPATGYREPVEGLINAYNPSRKQPVTGR
jgi:hypothetical protein